MTTPSKGPVAVYPYLWRVRTRLAARFGQRCRVLVRSQAMNSALVEFEDGYRVITSRNYLRKPHPPAGIEGGGG